MKAPAATLLLSGALLVAAAVEVAGTAPPAGPAACEATPASPDGRSASIPFDFYDNHVYVPATVEGTGPRSFLLDTGATVTAVDWSVAGRLDLPLRDPGASRGAGAATLRNARLPGVSVRVGGLDASGGAPLAMPLDSVIGPHTGRAAPGLVGFPFFRERVVEVDFDGRCVRVHDPDEFRYRGDGVVLPMQVRDGWAHVDGVLGLADGRRVEADLMVDTGFSHAAHLVLGARLAGVEPIENSGHDCLVVVEDRSLEAYRCA